MSIDKYLTQNNTNLMGCPMDIDPSLRVSHEHTDSGLGADPDYAYSSERSNDSKTKYAPPPPPHTSSHRISPPSMAITPQFNGIMKMPPKPIHGKEHSPNVSTVANE